MKRFNIVNNHSFIIRNRRLPIGSVYGCIDRHGDKLYYYVAPYDMDVHGDIKRVYISADNSHFYDDKTSTYYFRPYTVNSTKFNDVHHVIAFVRPLIDKYKSRIDDVLMTERVNKAISKAIREHKAIMSDAPHLKNHQQQLMFRANSREVNNTAVYESVPEVAAPFYMAVGEASQSYLTTCNEFHGFSC